LSYCEPTCSSKLTVPRNASQSEGDLND